MRGKWWATAALLASAMVCAPLALAASSGGAQPKPGSVFVGAPPGFASYEMHWRVASDGKSMALVGSFAWSYGCSRPLHNYGIADARTLKQIRGGQILFYPAPVAAIHASKFVGSTEFRRRRRKYQFTIRGTFTGARTANGMFTFSELPYCGVFTEHFKLQAS